MKNKIFIALLTTIGFNASAQTLKDAIRLNENEQHDDASAMYKSMISLEPTKGDYYYYWGNNLMDADKADSAAIIGGVVPVFNLDGIEQGKLKLTPDVIANIHLGRITKWCLFFHFIDEFYISYEFTTTTHFNNLTICM